YTRSTQAGPLSLHDALLIYPMNLPIGQFYEVSYDYAIPYNICGGAQDNGAWCGPSRRLTTPINNTYWFTISGGDGFYTAQDPTDIGRASCREGRERPRTGVL